MKSSIKEPVKAPTARPVARTPKIHLRRETTEADGKPCCPFCMKSDRLRKIWLSHERPDGTEYNGAALVCDHCDATAPASIWKVRAEDAGKGGAK